MCMSHRLAVRQGLKGLGPVLGQRVVHVPPHGLRWQCAQWRGAGWLTLPGTLHESSTLSWRARRHAARARLDLGHVEGAVAVDAPVRGHGRGQRLAGPQGQVAQLRRRRAPVPLHRHSEAPQHVTIAWRTRCATASLHAAVSTRPSVEVRARAHHALHGRCREVAASWRGAPGRAFAAVLLRCSAVVCGCGSALWSGAEARQASAAAPPACAPVRGIIRSSRTASICVHADELRRSTRCPLERTCGGTRARPEGEPQRPPRASAGARPLQAGGASRASRRELEHPLLRSLWRAAELLSASSSRGRQRGSNARCRPQRKPIARQ